MTVYPPGLFVDLITLKKMEASLKAKELLMQHYEKVSGVPANSISKLVQFFNTDSHWKTAKECALITVAYLKNENDEFKGMVGQTFNINYWKEVEAEIERL
jgi:hypothetical protein